MRKIVIAIDGFSGCGKSTTAKAVAHLLKYVYIDTGAMYRAVTLYFLEHYVNLTNPKQVQQSLGEIEIEFERESSGEDCEIYLNGSNVSHRIREMVVSDKVSEVSALQPVREKMVALQRKIGKKKGVVMDGRDIGTVVFPDAELKIFMTADLEVRAARRQLELLERGQMVDLEEITENLRKRDHLDTSRQISPLKQADQAHLIDTTHLTFAEQVEEILNLTTSVLAGIEHKHKLTAG
jgi:cytidylate kinase